MQKKKIAICLRDMQIGGVETVCINMIEALLKNPKLEIIVITYCPVTTKIYADWFAAHPMVRTYALYPCKWLGTNLVHFFVLRILQHAARDVYRWFRRITMNVDKFSDVDVFIDYYQFAFDKEFRRLHGPKISWWHSSSNRFYDGNYVRYLPRYDMLVTLTDGARNDFCARYPEYSSKITRIYNPINIADVRARASHANVDVAGDWFCCVSRLSVDKDIETLVRAFDKFWQEAGRPDVKLVIVGDGNNAQHFKSIAKSLPAAKNIIFTGALSNPFGYMKNAMANILSSVSEGLPTVLIEGMILNTLNIASDCPNGPREILLDGRAGLLYTPGDVCQLKKCLLDVWNNAVDIKKMKSAASNSLDRFDIKNVSNQISDLIEQI